MLSLTLSLPLDTAVAAGPYHPINLPRYLVDGLLRISFKKTNTCVPALFPSHFLYLFKIGA